MTGQYKLEIIIKKTVQMRPESHNRFRMSLILEGKAKLNKVLFRSHFQILKDNERFENRSHLTVTDLISRPIFGELIPLQCSIFNSYDYTLYRLPLSIQSHL